MGKDAANNTLFAENQAADQRLDSNISGQQFKGEQISEPMKQVEHSAGGFHGDKWHEHNGDQLKSTQTFSQMKQESAGGFHGDKFQERSVAEQHDNARRHSLTNSMGDEFPSEQFKNERFDRQFKTETILRPEIRSSIPVQSTATFSAGTVEPKVGASSIEASTVKSDIIKNDTREAKQEVLAEIKSHATHSDHIAPSEIHETATIHDGRLHSGMLQDGRTVAPALALSQDLLSDSVAFHDGRTAPVAEPNPMDKLPLAERIVAGVHAGDPLSFGNPLKDAGKKKDKKDKKLKKEKGEHTFGADEHFKKDKDLIPHEHLKKEGGSILADANMSGGAILQEESFRTEPFVHQDQTFIHQDQPLKSSLKKDKKDKKEKKDKKKHFENDTHLNKNVNIVDDLSFQNSADSQLRHEQDAFLINRDASFAEEGAGKQSLKDKAHMTKEKLKDKLGMSREENIPDSRLEGTAVKGHEIATIKIPGIESGDKAAQEMVNHQAKAKKELNAELKEHAGHSDHIAPSEIIGHGMEHMSLNENRAIDMQPLSNRGNALSDQITRDQVLAKSELNNEIKNQSGMMLKPSDFSHQFQSNDQFANTGLQNFSSNEFQQSNLKQFEGDRLTGFDASNAMNKDEFLAKKDLNAEIQSLGRDHIMPSDIAHKSGFQSNDFQSREFDNDAFSAKREVLAEINEAGAHSDNLHPSELASKDFHSQDLHGQQQGKIGGLVANAASVATNVASNAASVASNAANAMKETLHNRLQKKDDFQGKELDNDAFSAKREVLAEINEAGAHSDNLHPSELASKDFHNNKDLHGQTQNFDNTAEFQNSQFENNNEYLNDKPGGLGAMFKDQVMREHIQAKKELNAELKEVALEHPGQLLPSEISGLPAEGMTVIHDGRGSDRLKSEMNYEMAKDSIEASVTADNQPKSLTQKLGGLMANVTSVAASAAVAMKETLQNRLQKKDETDKDFQGKELDDDALSAKQEVLAEIEDAGAHSDNLHPSDFQSK